MGFWDVMKNMATGKPGFEDPGIAQSASRPTNNANTGSERISGKTIPTIQIQHCKSRIDHQTIDVRAWITNTSTEEIELDKITLLGKDTQLDRRLTAGQSHEVVLYQGRIPRDESYHKANVYYKTRMTGDYFCADFMIEYAQSSDGAYTIEDFHPENYGVRDI